MSSDNFYMVRKHPRGGYAAVMGFASDSREPEARWDDEQFDSIEQAMIVASHSYAEYGYSVHPECEAKSKFGATGLRYVMVIELDGALLDGDDSIDNAARIVNECLDHVEGSVPGFARPLSEVLAC